MFGEIMARQLRPEDRQAIDMLLDRSRSAVGFASEANVDPARLSAVSTVLHLLDNLPPADPPADLVARTLQRVGAEADHRTALPPTLRPALGGQQAHA
jgi:hypothetical protein